MSSSSSSGGAQVANVRPSDARRAALRDADSELGGGRGVPLVSNFFPIERYYDAADKVFQSFEHAFAEHRLDDAYVYGKRFATFSLDALPQHAYYRLPKYAKWRKKNGKDMALVIRGLEQVAKFMDDEEVQKAQALAKAQQERRLQLQKQKAEERKRMKEIQEKIEQQRRRQKASSSSNGDAAATGQVASSALHKLELLKNQYPPPTSQQQQQRQSSLSSLEGKRMDSAEMDEFMEESNQSWPGAQSSSSLSKTQGQLQQEQSSFPPSSSSSSSAVLPPLPPPIPPPPTAMDVEPQNDDGTDAYPPPPSYHQVNNNNSNVPSVSQPPAYNQIMQQQQQQNQEDANYNDETLARLAQLFSPSCSSEQATDGSMYSAAPPSPSSYPIAAGGALVRPNNTNYVVPSTLYEDDGLQPEMMIPKPVIERVSIRKLRDKFTYEYKLLLQNKKIDVFGLDTYQGRCSSSTNGCTVISPLVVAHHLKSAHAVSDDAIVNVIDKECGPILREIRSKLQLEGDALIIPSDVHDYMVDRKILSQEKFVGASGGNILDKDHLGEFLKMLERGEKDKHISKRAGAALFFREHVVSIVKVRMSGGTFSYDLVDSMPGMVDPNNSHKQMATRTRCRDLNCLFSLLKWYACKKFSDSNLAYIDKNAWSDMMADFDPRVFQAFVWADQ